MKGCLFLLAFAVFGVAVMVGAVVVVERTGAEKDKPLTQTASAVERTGSRNDPRGTPPRQVPGSMIEYRYQAGTRWFASSTWLASNDLQGLTVCLDPDDPAVHTVRTNDTIACGAGNLGTDEIRRATSIPSPAPTTPKEKR